MDLYEIYEIQSMGETLQTVVSLSEWEKAKLKDNGYAVRKVTVSKSVFPFLLETGGYTNVD